MGRNWQPAPNANSGLTCNLQLATGGGMYWRPRRSHRQSFTVPPHQQRPTDLHMADAKTITPLSATMTHAVMTVRPYELYMLVLSVVSLIVLAADTLWSFHPQTHAVLSYSDTLLCVLFMADFVRSFTRAPNRARYLFRSGWLDLLSSIPTFGILRLGRLSRIARIIRLFRAMRSFRAVGLILSQHKRESALLAAGTVCLLMTIFASVAILQFEQHPDSNIRTAGDAIWWAFATVTTDGYGDHFPVTLEGRLTAAMLMAAGVGLFGTLSGLVASWFLHEKEEADSDQLAALTTEVASIRQLMEEGRTVRQR
jgi:voltage-gated potassium channel